MRFLVLAALLIGCACATCPRTVVVQPEMPTYGLERLQSPGPIPGAAIPVKSTPAITEVKTKP